MSAFFRNNLPLLAAAMLSSCRLCEDEATRILREADARLIEQYNEQHKVAQLATEDDDFVRILTSSK